MSRLSVRKDWLVEFVQQNPKWTLIIKKVIEMNAFFVFPAKYAWQDGGVQDDDLVVHEQGVKGPPSAFRFDGDRIVCVNYPGSYKGGMTVTEFLVYIKKVADSPKAAWYLDQLKTILEKGGQKTSEKTYQHLLEELKAEKDPLPQIREQVKNILSVLENDLKGLNLEREDIVVQLVEAKFKESGISVQMSVALPKDRETLIGSVTVGNYPKSACNVEVAYSNGKCAVYVWRVPEHGNLR